jgi:hypothetical protein
MIVTIPLWQIGVAALGVYLLGLWHGWRERDKVQQDYEQRNRNVWRR